ncbi:XRE family transcriptional regulator [Cryobacterium arcticum]|uniref:XRE family transcriptional regulator n=2 Tax=Cryobacterium arcticum TaxID=670052 RepID=A0A1B1BLF2_9MICO|nr:XRE family transcriptional regulator [Cryobacterium arcticum]
MQLQDFLTSRRAKVQPEQVGLHPGTNRRVPGLRRGEVAQLAGVSVEYYTRMERGDVGAVSETVVNAVARALLLDDAERAHLFDLARTFDSVSPRPRRRPGGVLTVRPSLQFVLDTITTGPAFVRNGRMDVLAGNQLWRALYADMYAGQGAQPNLARFTILDRKHSEPFHPNWDLAADITVGILRMEAGRDPHDKDLHDLIDELTTRSEDFRRRWGAHNVRDHGTGTKHFRHPVVGDLHLVYEAAELVADPGLSLLIYGAEPGSSSAAALQLLGAWAATHENSGTSTVRLAAE